METFFSISTDKPILHCFAVATPVLKLANQIIKIIHIKILTNKGKEGNKIFPFKIVENANIITIGLKMRL